MHLVIRSACAVALLCASPALTGCASNQALRMSIAERDDEIRDLHEERTALQSELVRVRNERDGLQAALEDAATQLQGRPQAAAAVPAATPRFPDLDDQGITYGRRGNHIVFSIPSAVTFGSGKATLTSKGETALSALGDRLKSEFPDRAVFHVEGHTDSDPIQKSKFESNRDLSLERAKAVHSYLVTRCRIADERFVLVGHGQYRPIAANDTAENKAKNRRVEIVVHSD